jgi:hypothetical protein
MAKKQYESKSTFPVLRDVSNALGCGPDYNDCTSVAVTKGTMSRRAKWTGWKTRDMTKKQVDAARKMLREKYPDAELHGGQLGTYHNWSTGKDYRAPSTILLYWKVKIKVVAE